MSLATGCLQKENNPNKCRLALGAPIYSQWENINHRNEENMTFSISKRQVTILSAVATPCIMYWQMSSAAFRQPGLIAPFTAEGAAMTAAQSIAFSLLIGVFTWGALCLTKREGANRHSLRNVIATIFPFSFLLIACLLGQNADQLGVGPMQLVGIRAAFALVGSIAFFGFYALTAQWQLSKATDGSGPSAPGGH